MDLIQVMLSLGENNAQRVKIDPKIQLASLFQEIQEVYRSVKAAEKRLEQAMAMHKDCQDELDRLVEEKPQWLDAVEKAKESMVYQRGLSMREMLNIQQEVTRLEDDISQSDSKAANLRSAREHHGRRSKQLLEKLRELRTQYNQQAEVYNRDKAKADVLMAEYAAKEEELLKDVEASDKAVYLEALRLNPEDPVAVLTGDFCSGCRIGLSKQLINVIIKSGKLTSCENCLRVILPEQSAD